MFKNIKKRIISDVQEVRALGLAISHPNLKTIVGSLRFESPSSISNALIHGDCSIGHLSYIRNHSDLSNVQIGRYCSIAPGAFMGGGEHPTDWLSSHPFQYGGSGIFQKQRAFSEITGKKKFRQPKKSVRIGNDVWIGHGVNIARGVTVGDGAIIAARSMVTKDVQPYSIVAGIPAAEIRTRFPADVIQQLLRLQWWNYDLSPISKKIDYSDVPRAIELIEKSIRDKTLPPLNPIQYTIGFSDNEYYIK